MSRDEEEEELWCLFRHADLSTCSMYLTTGVAVGGARGRAGGRIGGIATVLYSGGSSTTSRLSVRPHPLATCLSSVRV